MKRLFFAALMLSSMGVFAQGRLGLKGGANYTNVFPVNQNKGSFNAHGGLFYIIKKNDQWSLQPELLVTEYHFYSRVQDDNLKLNYLLFPFVVKRHLTPSLNFQFGVQYGVLLDAELPPRLNVSATDFSALIGIGFIAADFVHFDFRMLPELTKVSYGSNYYFEEDDSLRKLIFQVSVGFVIPREGEWSKKE